MTEGYEGRPGGALFNKDPAKKVNPNQPDFDGYIVLDPALIPVLYERWRAGLPAKIEVAAWKKKSARGVSFLSFNGGRLPKDQQQQAAQPRGREAPTPFNDDLDDEIPF